jgi:hypothetical protein
MLALNESEEYKRRIFNTAISCKIYARARVERAVCLYIHCYLSNLRNEDFTTRITAVANSSARADKHDLPLLADLSKD